MDNRSSVVPNSSVVFQLPSGVLKIVKIVPNTLINLTKIGSFQSNLIIGRPYNITYEILDRDGGDGTTAWLRPIPASELVAETTSNDDDEDEISSFDIVAEDGSMLMRNNRLTVDDPSRQALTMEDIEDLKKVSATSGSSGKDIIDKIMLAHSAIEEKTAFSLAKYTLRKSRKYMKRFTILPLDVNTLIDVEIAREPNRIMHLRKESLGLITSWANVHVGVPSSIGGGRWLVVDDTCGLITAAVAEKMGLLHYDGGDEPTKDINPPYASSNTLTIIHPSIQGNLALLKHFGYTVDEPNSHPLHSHLKNMSWLQVLDPEADALYHEPPLISDDDLAQMKSGKRGTYWRKRRRWERVERIVDETRAGGFDGLIIGSYIEPLQILQHLVPLLRGGGQIVVYSPTVEPLSELMDLYSRERKSAYIRELQQCGTTTAEDFPLNPSLVLNPMLQTSRARHWQVLPGRTHPVMTSKGGPEGYLFTGTRVMPSNVMIHARGKYGKKRKRENGIP